MITLLEERPFREITVDDLMAKAGQGRTAFYRYFPDLEAVLLHLIGIVAADLHAASDAWLTSDDPNATLEETAAKMVDTFRHHGRVLRAIRHSSGVGEDIEDAWIAVITAFVDPAIIRVQMLIDDGRADVEHPDQVVRALVVVIEAYLTDVYGADRDALDPAIATATLATLWRRSLRLSSR